MAPALPEILHGVVDPLLEPLKAKFSEKALEIVAIRLRAIAEYAVRQISDRNVIRTLIEVEAARSDAKLYEYLDQRIAGRGIGGITSQLMRRGLGGRVLIIPVIKVHERVVLGELTTEPIVELPNWYNSSFVKSQSGFRRTIDDKLVFGVRRMAITPSKCTIFGCLTRYGSLLAIQDELEWEILREAPRHLGRRDKLTNFVALDKALVARRSVDDSFTLVRDSSACNGMAISTLVVYRGKGSKYRIMVGKRSRNTAAHPDLLHVIPAGMFQPELNAPREEWDIRHNFLKEYGEELFNQTVDEERLTFDYFYRSWPSVKAVLRALRSGKAEFHVTGIIVNALNYRPEICSLLLVHDRAWWRGQMDKMETNWEYAKRRELFQQTGRARTEYSLEDAENEFFEDFGTSPGMWVPPGLAAFWLGVDKARELLETRGAA